MTKLFFSMTVEHGASPWDTSIAASHCGGLVADILLRQTAPQLSNTMRLRLDADDAELLADNLQLVADELRRLRWRSA